MVEKTYVLCYLFNNHRGQLCFSGTSTKCIYGLMCHHFWADTHNIFLLKTFNICPKMVCTMRIKNNGTSDLLMFNFYPMYAWCYNILAASLPVMGSCPMKKYCLSKSKFEHGTITLTYRNNITLSHYTIIIYRWFEQEVVPASLTHSFSNQVARDYLLFSAHFS